MSISSVEGALAGAARIPIAPAGADAARSSAGAPRSPEAEKAAEPASPNKEAVQSAVDRVQKFVQSTSADLHFSVDEQSGETVVKVVDNATKSVIRQIPSQEMLDIAKALDHLQGLLVRQKA